MTHFHVAFLLLAAKLKCCHLYIAVKYQLPEQNHTCQIFKYMFTFWPDFLTSFNWLTFMRPFR